jgi:hypothetical protein
MGVSGQRQEPAALYARGKNRRYPLDRKLGGPQIWPGHRDYRKKPSSLPVVKPRSSTLWSDTILSELPRLLQETRVPLASLRVILLNDAGLTDITSNEECHGERGQKKGTYLTVLEYYFSHFLLDGVEN